MVARAAEREDIYARVHDLRMARMQWTDEDAVKSEMAAYRSALNQLEAGVATVRPVRKWTEVTGGKRRG